MKAEIIIKDITHPRMSIAPNRLVIKFPETFEDKDRVIKFVYEIKEKLQGQLKFGLQGRFIKPIGCDFYKKFWKRKPRSFSLLRKKYSTAWGMNFLHFYGN